MITKIQKWGNSLALRIPRAFAADTNIHEGSIVDLIFREGKLIIVPVEKNKFNLSDLLNQINDENLHDEIITGEPVGAELW
ncbi:AbrB/MazE/SpoVT family DNA-binding domain-containing protein [bacterium]|nr:MAG: AbrB/MazE/SpoVT family DNA-binding domain-containing protein [bacterium]